MLMRRCHFRDYIPYDSNQCLISSSRTSDVTSLVYLQEIPHSTIIACDILQDVTTICYATLEASSFSTITMSFRSAISRTSDDSADVMTSPEIWALDESSAKLFQVQ